MSNVIRPEILAGPIAKDVHGFLSSVGDNFKAWHREARASHPYLEWAEDELRRCRALPDPEIRRRADELLAMGRMYFPPSSRPRVPRR